MGRACSQLFTVVVSLVTGAAGVGCTAIAVSDGGTGAADATSTGTTTPAGGTSAGSAQGTSTTSGFTASSGATSTGMTGTSGSASTGIACVPADCADDEPCTVDTCDPGSGTCTHDPRPAGMPGDLTEGPCEGVCQTDGHCGLAIYRRALGVTTWTKEAVSQMWSGANAPPPRGIVAAESGSTYETMVLNDDGNVYRRIAGAWVAPVTGSALFGVDTSTAVAIYGLTGDGSDLIVLWYLQGGAMFSLTATISGESVSVDSAGNSCSPSTGFPCDLTLDWATNVGPGFTGAQWYRFADGNVYRWEGFGYQGASAETMSDAWGDAATAPVPGTVRAALVVGFAELQLVAP